MKLNVFKQTATRVPRAQLLLLPDVVLRGEKLRGMNGAVNLVFTDDRAMRRLNRDYRGIDRSTDVLSFNLDDGRERDSILGEIYISAHTAARQAAEEKTSLAAEYLRLAVHGFLHLLGYDHADPGEEQRMMRLQEGYLKRLTGGRR